MSDTMHGEGMPEHHHEFDGHDQEYKERDSSPDDFTEDLDDVEDQEEEE